MPPEVLKGIADCAEHKSAGRFLLCARGAQSLDQLRQQIVKVEIAFDKKEFLEDWDREEKREAEDYEAFVSESKARGGGSEGYCGARGGGTTGSGCQWSHRVSDYTKRYPVRQSRHNRATDVESWDEVCAQHSVRSILRQRG